VSIGVPKDRVRRMTRDRPALDAHASYGALGWLAAVGRTVISGGLSIFRKKRRAKTVVDEVEREHLRRLEFAEEFARGYLAGWKECFRACQEAIEEGSDGGWNN
jgi:hypothetical protein